MHVHVYTRTMVQLRVPFNAIVLGLDGLSSYPELQLYTAIKEDVIVMKDSAEAMQRILSAYETLRMTQCV